MLSTIQLAQAQLSGRLRLVHFSDEKARINWNSSGSTLKIKRKPNWTSFTSTSFHLRYCKVHMGIERIRSRLIERFCSGLTQDKYSGRNSSSVIFSYWDDFARSLAGTKNSPKSMCSHVIFVIHFQFQVKNSGGEDI